MAKILRIGTRTSQLALTQTHMVADAIRAAAPEVKVEIVELHSSADWKPSQGETRLSEAKGGKGMFAREIEQALLDHRVDCGVHSLKDMASFLPAGLVIRHMLPRADVRDAFLSNGPRTIADLPAGAVVGTSSLRRQAFLLARRPDLKVTTLRGNVPTRIEKLRAGQVDATFLAVAGLTRLNLMHEASSILEPEEMLPSAGQGAIGIELRADDAPFHVLFDKIHCRVTGLRVAAERAALAVLDGSCHTPIGAYAVLDDGRLTLSVCVASPDGALMFDDRDTAVVRSDADAEALGAQLGARLKARLPAGFLS